MAADAAAIFNFQIATTFKPLTNLFEIWQVPSYYQMF
jgi:hypothetical protein